MKRKCTIRGELSTKNPLLAKVIDHAVVDAGLRLVISFDCWPEVVTYDEPEND